MPVHMNVHDKQLKKSYIVDGRGGSIDLLIAGTFDTEHEFSLDIGYMQYIQKCTFKWMFVNFFSFNCFRAANSEFNDLILTYKNIDKKTFFAIPVQSIDDVIKELVKPNELKWPCISEKEVIFSKKIFC